MAGPCKRRSRKAGAPLDASRRAAMIARASVVALGALPPLVQAAGEHDALHPAGAQAGLILSLGQATATLCLLVFLAVLLATALALWRAARRDASRPPDLSSLDRPERGLNRVVVAATAVSVLALFALVLADVFTDRALAELPQDGALHIELVGHQWWWEARYPAEGGLVAFSTANELHIPVGRAVHLDLTSADVIHSVWLPNLAGKQDMLPGRRAGLSLRAERTGVFRGQCAEFCGVEHALMVLTVHADTPQDYRAWQRREAAPAADLPHAVRAGRQLFVEGDCARCHTVRGTPAAGSVGPDLTHVASRLTLAAGSVPNTHAMLAAWIADPHAIKPGTTMPATRLAPADLAQLLAYLETLR